MVDRAIITTQFVGDASGLKQAIQDAAQTGKGLESALSTIKGQIASAFSVGALITFAQEIGRVANEITNVSQRMNISVETVQTMALTYKRAGLDAGTFESQLNKLQRALSEAGTGSKSHNEALRALGLTYDDLAKLKPEEQFERIAKALADNKDSVEATNAAYVIFGRDAGKSLEIIRKVGVEGFAKLNEEARNSAQIMSKDVTEVLNGLHDSLQTVTTAAKNLGAELVAAPGILAKALAELIYEQKIEAENAQLIQRSLEAHARRNAEKAKASKEAAEAAEREKALQEALTEYEKTKAELAEKRKTTQERITEVSQQINEIESKLLEYYNTRNISAVEAARLETELLKLKDKKQELEEKLAKEILPEQNRLMREQAEAQKRQLEEREKLRKLDEQINGILKSRYEKSLTNEQKLADLIEEQKRLKEQLAIAEKEGRQNTEEYKKTLLRALEVEDKIADLQKTIADDAKRSADAMEDFGDEALKIAGPDGGMTKISKSIADLSKHDMKRLIDNLKELQKVFAGIQQAGGFPKIELPDLSKFQIPSWLLKGNASFKMNNFLHALSGLLNALQGKDLGGLERLGQAFAKMQLPDMTKVDVEGLVKILKATSGAKFGELKIALDVPKDGVKIDTSNLKLDEIAESLNTLAGLRGIAWW